jgi:hypothetical protein
MPKAKDTMLLERRTEIGNNKKERSVLMLVMLKNNENIRNILF